MFSQPTITSRGLHFTAAVVVFWFRFHQEAYVFRPLASPATFVLSCFLLSFLAFLRRSPSSRRCPCIVISVYRFHDLLCFIFLFVFRSTVGSAKSFCRFPTPYTFVGSLSVCVNVFPLSDRLSFHVDPYRFRAVLFSIVRVVLVSGFLCFRSRPCLQRPHLALVLCCAQFSLLSECHLSWFFNTSVVISLFPCCRYCFQSSLLSEVT